MTFSRLTLAALGLLIPVAALGQTGFSVSSAPVEVAASPLPESRPAFLDVSNVGAITALLVQDRTLVSVDAEEVRRLELAGRIVRATASRSGRFQAALTLQRPENGSRQALMSLEVFDNGRSLFSTSIAYREDDPLPSVLIDDRDGAVAILQHAAGRVTFLSAAGEQLAARSVTDGGHDIERSIVAARSDDTGSLAVIVNEPVHDGIHSVAAERIRLFSRGGEELAGFALPEHTVAALAFSRDASRIAVGSYDVTGDVFRTTLYGASGNETYQVDFCADRIEFDASGDNVLAASKRRLAIVSTDAGQTLLDTRVLRDGHGILDVGLSEDGSLAVAIAGTARFDSGRLVLGDLELTEFVLSDSDEFTPESRTIDESAHAVGVSIDGAGVAVALDARVLFFERPQ